MNKLAIIISGHLRTFEQTVKSWNILLKYKPDIFIHTYSEIGYWSSNTTVDLSQQTSITEDYIRNILVGHNIVDIVIEPTNKYHDEITNISNMYTSRKVHYARPYNFVSMHLKRKYALKRFFEVKIQHYDMVYLLRPDIYLDDRIELPLSQSKELYVSAITKQNNILWFGDLLLVGSENNILKILNAYNDIFELYKVNYNDNYDPHSFMAYFITQLFDLKDVGTIGYLSQNIRNTKKGYCV